MDAKLFYHQQQHTPQSGAGGSYYSSPLMRAQTLPPHPGNTLSRTASMKSFGSHHHYLPQQALHSPGLGRSAIPLGMATLDKPAANDEVQVPSGMERFDPHRVTKTDKSAGGSYVQGTASPGHGVGQSHDQGFASSRCTPYLILPSSGFTAESQCMTSCDFLAPPSKPHRTRMLFPTLPHASSHYIALGSNGFHTYTMHCPHQCHNC